MEKAIELLAPAGNMECLIAAVRNGADAVYFGGGAFNARRSAANFTGEALKEAIDFCRLRNVKTHITLNTLLFDRELEDALRFARELARLHADAVIVQDTGLAALIREQLPELDVHASTQMGIHSLGGLKYCEELGIMRAVLAREVPLEEIRRMHESSPVELEFFCHGALCMGFSGSCLYSSMAGERSGNRGTCAQPCRKNATVLRRRAGADEFALSTNDIAMIDELDALAEAGICSLKIEGRMKSPEYVATVTRVYRAALDGEKPRDARKKLFEIFNRGEFSSSHIRGDSVTTGHVGSAKPPRELVAEAHESFARERPVREASACLTIEEGRPARLRLSSGGCTALVTGDICSKAERPADKERLAEQLKKLGGTVFYPGDADIAGAGFIPLSALNALRREAVSKLEKALLDSVPPFEEREVSADKRLDLGPAGEPPLVYSRVRTADELRAARGDIIGFDPALPDQVDTESLALAAAGRRLVLILPNVLITEGARAACEKLLSSGVFAGVEVNNISHRDMGLKLPLRIAGIGMNVMNCVAASRLLSMGFTHFMPSPELTRPQLADMAKRLGSRMIVNTLLRTPLMQLMHCPVKEYRGCRGCRGKTGMLADGEGRLFPLENVRFAEGYCLVRMLNSALTDVREAFAASGMRVYAAAETADSYPDTPVTRGHWSRAVD